jgi:dipeptidyl aminopeptidase/acylaminoacyl peptidase
MCRFLLQVLEPLWNGAEFVARERLKGNWGIADVSDCIEAVRSSELSPIIDTERTAIRGGSSGGYTALASISLDSSAASKRKFFACATSNYGISNLELLADDTHKFELQYMIKLLGGRKQEIPQVYHDRSPMYFSANIRTPLLVRSQELGDARSNG